jgi:hypothetical protein
MSKNNAMLKQQFNTFDVERVDTLNLAGTESD